MQICLSERKVECCVWGTPGSHNKEAIAEYGERSMRISFSGCSSESGCDNQVTRTHTFTWGCVSTHQNALCMWFLLYSSVLISGYEEVMAAAKGKVVQGPPWLLTAVSYGSWLPWELLFISNLVQKNFMMSNFNYFNWRTGLTIKKPNAYSG